MNANERLIGESRPLSLDPDGGGPLPTSRCSRAPRARSRR